MTIVIGHDRSDSGDDAATLGAVIAKAAGENLVAPAEVCSPIRGAIRR